MAKKCMKCGGAMKMAKGGSVKKPFAAGIPYATGAGATDGKNGMMKKGGAVKKMQAGGASGKALKSRGYDMEMEGISLKNAGSYQKDLGREMKIAGKVLKSKGMAKKAEGQTLKAAGKILTKKQKGGETKFGMLSVKAGIDKNPKATAADRIAGAKRNAKKK